MAVITLIGPWIAPQDPYAIVGPEFEPIGGEFLLGTDNEGRDTLSLMLQGTRVTVWTALVYTLPAFGLGSLLGLLSGTIAGWTDRFLNWAADTIHSVPPFVWFILILTWATLGLGFVALVCALSIVFAAPVFKLARAIAHHIPARSAQSQGGLWGRIGSKPWLQAGQTLAVEFGLRFCFIFMFLNGLTLIAALRVSNDPAHWVVLTRNVATTIIYGDIMWIATPLAALIIVPLSVHLLVGPFRQPANGLYDTVNLNLAFAAEHPDQKIAKLF